MNFSFRDRRVSGECIVNAVHLERILSDKLYAAFKEATIDFKPTYKYDLRLDSSKYVKHRIPSYTVTSAICVLMAKGIEIELFVGSHSLSGQRQFNDGMHKIYLGDECETFRS
jgi:hypothetical protein